MRGSKVRYHIIGDITRSENTIVSLEHFLDGLYDRDMVVLDEIDRECPLDCTLPHKGYMADAGVKFCVAEETVGRR